MVIVQKHNLKKRMQYLGNYGVGIGKVYGLGKRRFKKKNKIFESLGNRLLDFGVNLYDQNKDKINQVIKDKAGDVVNKIVDKAKTSDVLPEFAKKKIVENSDLISNVSKKYIDQMVNKGSKFADTGVNIAQGTARLKLADMAGPITPIPYIKREPAVTTYPQSSNMYTGRSDTNMATTQKPGMYGFGHSKYRSGRGLNIL
jgi:type III secretion system FlhB-like substrate exporter